MRPEEELGVASWLGIAAKNFPQDGTPVQEGDTSISVASCRGNVLRVWGAAVENKVEDVSKNVGLPNIFDRARRFLWHGLWADDNEIAIWEDGRFVQNRAAKERG